MKKLLLFCIFLLLSQLIFAQKTDDIYRFSEHIQQDIDKDTTPWKNQLAATKYSLSAYYEKALHAWSMSSKPFPQLSKEDSFYLNKYKAIDAKEYIINQCKTEQIIIINEAHHHSRHRVFTASLLKDLYDNGFRYLALEALFDTLINERKYAILESGYYTAEPEFANLIHEALILGFELINYEALVHENPKEREIKQAQNIYKILQKNPNAKIVVYCGYAHAYEHEYMNWGKAMAGRLQEISGINPFTIDQEFFSEKGSSVFSFPFIYSLKPNNSIVLIDEFKNVFSGFKQPYQTDIVVIHTPTTYIKNIPKWNIKNRKKSKIPFLKKAKNKLLILAYRANENIENAVPVAVQEYNPQLKNNYLFLPKNKYTIIIKNTKYEIINTFFMHVK